MKNVLSCLLKDHVGAAHVRLFNLKQLLPILMLLFVTLIIAACAGPESAPTPVPTVIDIEPTFTPPATVIVTETDSAIITDAIITDTEEFAATEAEVQAETAPVPPVAETIDESNAPTETVPAEATTMLSLTASITPTAVVDDEKPIQAITVGINPELDPFETINEEGNLVGFDIDIINAIAQATAIEVSFVPMDFDQLLPAVAGGDLDVAISAISWTEERAAIVAFSDPYFTSDQSPVSFFGGGLGLAVRSETTDIQGAADLTEAVVVGVKSGTTGDLYVIENSAAQVVRYDEAPDALNALANGEVQAVVTDIPVIAEFVINHPELNVQLMGAPLTTEEYVIAVNQERLDLLQLLNAGLVRIREDGTYDQIFEKWFQLP